jgi:serine/threonine-protein phosphatase 2A regulatory subunit B''
VSSVLFATDIIPASRAALWAAEDGLPPELDDVASGDLQAAPKAVARPEHGTASARAVDAECSPSGAGDEGVKPTADPRRLNVGQDVQAGLPDPREAQGSVLDLVTERRFREFYARDARSQSRERRLFKALLPLGAKRDYLTPSDFKVLLRALLLCHQGLSFLHATPEFQLRYSETVVERIFFSCTQTHNGRLTLQDIKRSRLLDTLMMVDEEEDINRERRYFSYEHFYVLYCRFWELDTDHDLQIDREDLMRYGGHSLTYRIVDRIFGGYARRLDNVDHPGYMSYTDFIWFCLSEEDKNSETAIDYWFRCVDMDGDGLITMYDMEYFYKEQLHRMECFGHEPVQIRDILCQLLDMVKPNSHPPHIKRCDLKACCLAGNFFNVLFNLNKFFALEARDPLQIRQEHATPELTDWDRFAALEYLRLSAEEEGDEDESWEEVGDAMNAVTAGEAPF